MKGKRQVPETLAQLTAQVKEYIEELIFSEDEVTKRGAKKKQDLQKGRLRQALHKCSLGSEKGRLFVKEFIKEVISEDLALSDGELFALFPVRSESRLSAQDCFEILLYIGLRRYGKDGFVRLCRKYRLPREPESFCAGQKRDLGNLKSTFGKSTLENPKSVLEKSTSENQGKFHGSGAGKNGGYVYDGYEISERELRHMMREERMEFTYPDLLELLAQRVYQELYGFSFFDRLISQELAVDGVSAGNNTVYVMLMGKKIWLSFLSFESENSLARIVRKLSRNHPQTQLSRKNCAMVLGLQNNVRVTLARPPAAEGWNFYVRKFNTISAGQLKELLTDENAELAISLLRILVRGCANLVITGEQASGKTTLLKALVRFIDGKYSIRLAEGASEMHLEELYPERNIFSMQEYGELQLEGILSLFKKTDTDVTICGEINAPQTAEAFVQISQSGGRFTMCTSHHNTTERLISYMRNALLKGAGFGSERIATEQVVEALHFDIHLETDKSGHRYIERITEIEREQQMGYRLNEILVFSDGAYRQTGRIGGEHQRRICKYYPEWKKEYAAEMLGRTEHVGEVLCTP